MPSQRRLPGTLRSIPSRLSLSAPEPVTSSQASEANRFFHLSADLLCILESDAQGILRLRHTNPAWGRLLGYDSPTPLNGTSLLELTHPEDRSAAAAELTQNTAKFDSIPHVHMGASPSIESSAAIVDASTLLSARFRAADGSYRWLEWTVSAPDGLGLRYAVARDITESKAAEAVMQYQASHDPLTGLPNRALLQDRLGQALASAARRDNQLAVLFLDLDRFKPINDTLGHDAGDALLREIATRLRGSLREEDTIARLGGDEFVAVLPTVNGANDALQVAQKLLHQVARPLHISGHELYVTASIGVSLFPQDGRTAEALLRNADLAMYRAKSGGRGQATLHDETTNQVALERVMMQSWLRQAMDRREMRLHYQPQVSLQSGAVIGVEALMRWKHHEMGQVSPSKFIPLAEETGLIVPLGGWAVREACRQAADWERSGFPLRMSVNLSALQLTDERFPVRLEQHLAEIGLSAQAMDLELTESTFIRNDTAALHTLHRLKDMGVQLSVDDFGTGYSSLAYLRRFPIDGVKVDRSFIANLEHSPADEAVVRAVIDLSHTLGLRVIAEGVETAWQYERLQSLGCDAMQGYYFSAAIPALDVPRLVAAGGTPAPPLTTPRYDR